MRDDWLVSSEASVRALVAGYVGDEAMARRSVEILHPLSADRDAVLQLRLTHMRLSQLCRMRGGLERHSCQMREMSA